MGLRIKREAVVRHGISIALTRSRGRRIRLRRVYGYGRGKYLEAAGTFRRRAFGVLRMASLWRALGDGQHQSWDGHADHDAGVSSFFSLAPPGGRRKFELHC